MRKYKKPGVSKIAHVATNRRPVGMQVTGDTGSLGEMMQDTSEADAKLVVRRLKDAGEIIANYCRISADKFSVRIPLSLSVKTSGNSVYIEGGGPAAPNAYPFDPPNNPPVWHPVHAHGPRRKWNWAPQPYRPFLEVGAEAGADKAAEAFAEIIDDWSKDLGSDHP